MNIKSHQIMAGSILQDAKNDVFSSTLHLEFMGQIYTCRVACVMCGHIV